MIAPPTNKCEICGKPKGRHFDHAKCSKLKQKMHSGDRRHETKKHLNADNINAIIKSVELTTNVAKFE